MSPTKIERQSKSFDFERLERRLVVADVSGGSITSDAGLVLVAQLDKQYQITQRFAQGFKDERDPKRVQHLLEDLIAQRVYGLVQGYPDLNDHDQLRFDRMFGLAVGKLESQHARCAPLAGKSTLNRRLYGLLSGLSTRAGAVCENDSGPAGAGAGVFGAVFCAA